MQTIKLALTVVTALVLSACAAQPQPLPVPDDPFYAPAVPEASLPAAVPNGSLFNGEKNNLYSDIKARDLGDIITVRLQESTSASKSAKTGTSRGTSVNLPTPTVLGKDLSFRGYSLSANLEGSTEFQGDASANQSNRLSGDISVTVIRVLPNGSLIVRGEKWLTLNNGQEYVRLTGMIRPQDVASDNTVLSNRVANARIEYSGTGSLADTQRQGWLTRFFNGPLWPL